MISHVLLLAFLAAPASAPPRNAPPRNPNAERQAYMHCVDALVRSDLKAKVEPKAFEAKIATICQPQETAFRAASIAADTSVGVRRAQAEQNVASEIEDFRATRIDNYSLYFDSNSLPR
jgi:hypothetical protein